MLTRLPPVRGRYTENAPLGETSWFRCGGRAEVLYKPADAEDLSNFLKGCPEDIPVTVLGVCSNVIIRDGGIKGVTIKLGGSFAEIEVDTKEGIVSAGAAALDINVATAAQRAGLAGLEFLSGIPGSVGGAVRMNAGAYGRETVDVLIEATTLDRMGQFKIYKPSEMDMSYRYNGIPENFIFTGAKFRGVADDSAAIEARMNEIKEKRAATQPVRARTGGSTFANPTPDELRAHSLPEGMKAWQMIDKVGGRGLAIGGAQMSELHCNFMLNNGNATSAELEALGEEIRRRVMEQFGYSLRWEIKRIGEFVAVGNA
ncbi:MAG: UDP-N-acetylmuramate dehydrogenase [Alphaproteobacteria bacterium]|nr:UDP-N-acetylmuramate dehydrogenase [Alphaproteobacteria bacterium]